MYVGELIEDNRCESPPVISDCKGPDITQDGVQAAIKQTKGGKSPGEEKITSEILWRALGPFRITKFKQLFYRIYSAI